jgi:predicted nucleic acid-binding protein
MLAHLGSAEQVLTTNLVVGETWTFLRRKDGHRTALAFLDRIGALQQQSKLVVHRVTFDQEDKAWASGRIRTPNGPE